MSNNGRHQEARETIQSFTSRYAPLYPNGDHVELMQLAAFPVAVTVHLLYQIWANFGTFIKNGVACKIEALAVNDCIQGNLFRQTGPDLFEMDADVRRCLLEDLRANRGSQFVKEELAAFLYQYSRQNTQGSAWRNYYDAQQWTAIMEVDEKAAAEQILSSLAQELQKKNTSRGLGIVNLMAALEKDNKQFSGLLQNALNKPDGVQAEPGAVTSKRIVLTDEMVEGRTPVRINLPPSLSNRLKKIIIKEPSSKDESETRQQGTTYGIFVGINNYADKQFDLHESVNDARKMRVALENAQLLDAENARLIIDKEATRAHVVNLLADRLSTARSEDTIVFYFSGHSSNQHHDSALFFHDFDQTSEYTSKAENGILADLEFKEMVKAAPNNPTIILILDTHGGSRQWLDENNPKHIAIMATHLEEMCYELAGVGGMLTESIAQCLGKQQAISYLDLYQSVLNRFLAFAHDGNAWQTPLFIVHKDHWNDVFLSETADAPNTAPRTPKTYEYLQTRDTVQCLFYSRTEPGAFTFYNQVKFALHENRVDLEHLNTWAAIDKSFSVHNRFPDMIFIALKQNMYVQEAKYNIEKLLTIADVMQIPVYFILEDRREPDPSTYISHSLLAADRKPVLSGIDVTKLISDLKAITEPLVKYLKPEEEEYETWGISIGITHYENLPGLPPGVSNARRFSDWLFQRLKNKISQENYQTFTTGSDRRIRKGDIDDSVFKIARTPREGKKRLFYIYVCGYALENADVLLCLPKWSERAAREVINIDSYVKMLSYSGGFDKLIVFAEFAPIHIGLKEPLSSDESFTLDTLTSTPAPSCVFKVQLDRFDNMYSKNISSRLKQDEKLRESKAQLTFHDDTSSEKNSIILDGLEGEAKLGNKITVSSLTTYLRERAKREGIAQFPEVTLKDTIEKDFLIATLDPSFNSSDDTWNFKQKWVLIAGSSRSRLSQPEWMITNAIAIKLARSGYGIITGGWRGVDAVVSEAYATQLSKDAIPDEGYLIQVVLEKQELEYPGGLIERVANEEQSYERIFARAYAMIMIGGVGGTFISFRKAKEANVPVIPIAITGGDAAEAHAELKKRKILPSYLLDELTKPVNSYEEAMRTADAICNYLDEGLSNQYYRPDPA